jgi:hypothetical protein
MRSADWTLLGPSFLVLDLALALFVLFGLVAFILALALAMRLA